MGPQSVYKQKYEVACTFLWRTFHDQVGWHDVSNIIFFYIKLSIGPTRIVHAYC
jgi:hypothetical protein